MRIIHLETLVVSSFGLLDNDGNVIQTHRIPEPLKIGVLSEDSFKAANKWVADYKVELQKQLDNKIAEEKAAKEVKEPESTKSE